MKNLKLIKLIDFIFINFLLFLILFAWLRFLTKNFNQSIVLSIVLLFLFNFIKYFFNKTKQDKIKIYKNLEQDIEDYNITLLSNTNEENLKFFAGGLKGNQIEILKEQNLVLFYSEPQQNQKTCLCPFYFEKELKYETALKLIKIAIIYKCKKIILCCYYCKPKIKNELEKIDNLQVKIWNKISTFENYFKVYNVYPEIMFKFKKNKKIKYKDLFNASFDKTRAKSYFLSGLFILFCSFFVKYNFYYVFMSSLLFLFALICKTKKDNL